MVKEIIINGGDPIDDCPRDWDKAKAWVEKVNSCSGDYNPKWSFDCGFKLDFNGPIAGVSSRFYPPKTHYGPNWDGDVNIFVLGRNVKTIKIIKPSLEELRARVEEIVREIAKKLEDSI